MAASRTFATHPLHHQAVQQHFGIGPKAYKASATKGIPGLQVTTAEGFYRVETFADRVSICQDQLSSVGDAAFIQVDAGLLLDGLEYLPGFFSCVLDVLDEFEQPMRYAQAKTNLSLALSIAQLTEESVWETMQEIDQDLIGACLVAATRIPGGEQLATALASLYFVHGQELLCEWAEGHFAHFPFAGSAIIIYEAVEWD